MQHAINQIEDILTQIETALNTQLNQKSSTKAIYLYGSYPRKDFIIGRSDIDFAIILSLDPNYPHWKHPEFIQISKLIEEKIALLPKAYFRQENPDNISFSIHEVELALNGELKADVGPNKCLTFLAFDFLTNNRLLWGENLLKKFFTIPDPVRFAKERLEWIKETYEQKKREDQSEGFKIMVTLGSIIRHYAVLAGLRSLKRGDLAEWTENYDAWLQILGNHDIFNRYFQYITGTTDDPPFNDKLWVIQTRGFIQEVLY